MLASTRLVGLLGWVALGVPLGADSLATLPSPATGLRVYFIRHGQAFSNLDPEPELPPEQLDHLTELGQRQADKAGAAILGRGITAVLTSPATRARETADRIALALGTGSPRVEARLRPLQLGRRSANGPPHDWDSRIAAWEAGRDPSPEGGESMAALGDRVADLLAALLADPAGGQGTGMARSIVLVAHGEVIGAYLGRLRGTAPAKRYPPGLGNASISVVDVTTQGARERLADYRPVAP